jgi:hypothetical protein
MFKEKLNSRLFLILGVVVIAMITRALTRNVEDLSNFTPLGAIFLFSGAYFSDKKFSFIVPMVAMFITDLFVGFHSTMPFVYGAFAISILIGFQLRNVKEPKAIKIVGASLLGSVLFFLITNFGAWLAIDFYPKTIDGLSLAYVEGIPFFRNTIVGDLFYSSVFFGAFELAKRYDSKFDLALN